MATVSLKSSDDRLSSIKMAVKRLDSDVEIISSEGDILLANSFLMSKASPFLQSLLLPLLPTDNSTFVRIHLPDVSKHGLSHLINILKQGYSSGPGSGNFIMEEVQEAARALGFTELPVLTMSSHNEYIEEAGDNYEKKIKPSQYCILCQMHGHSFSEACVVNARCLDCGVVGHVRRDCKKPKSDSKSKIKEEIKREYGDIKEEKYDLKIIKVNFKYDVKDTKVKKENYKCEEEEEEYVELESPKDEEIEKGEDTDKIENNNTLVMDVVTPAPLPLAHQEAQQPSNSCSPRGNKAGPAQASRKLPKRKRKAYYGSFFENIDDVRRKVKKGKKECPKGDDEAHGDAKYRCTKCDFKSSYKWNVKVHHEAVHDKIKYLCSECEFETTHKSNLKTHIKSVHEGIKYTCSECEYKTTTLGRLNRHSKSIHEGVKYPCFECEYKATRKSDLNLHVRSIHKGVKYPCSECEYKATQKSSLKTHIMRVHNKRTHDSDSEDMMRNLTEDPDSDSSHSLHGRKQQPKRKVQQNKKIPAENDLISTTLS